MPKLTILRGLPASGKTTLAKQLVKDSGNTVRLNRDELRSMLFNGKWSGPREGVIKKLEREMARVALQSKQSVVVDDTNLTEGHRVSWSQLAQECSATFAVEKFDTPVRTCVSRDFERHLNGDRAVGPAVIYRMAAENGLLDFGEPQQPIVLVDLDGTLCEISHRLKYIQQCKKCGQNVDAHGDEVSSPRACLKFTKDWDSFHAAAILCQPL